MKVNDILKDANLADFEIERMTQSELLGVSAELIDKLGRTDWAWVVTSIRSSQRVKSTLEASDGMHVKLAGMDLRGANLLLADLNGTIFEGAGLTGARLNESVRFMAKSLKGANLKAARLEADPPRHAGVSIGIVLEPKNGPTDTT